MSYKELTVKTIDGVEHHTMPQGHIALGVTLISNRGPRIVFHMLDENTGKLVVTIPCVWSDELGRYREVDA
jgi:hypothetical protein